MAAKRAATTTLNHDNWNEEDEPENPGTFAKATEDILEKRVIKTAKRRLPAKDENAKSAFGSFMGFKNTPTTTASPFSFLAGTNTGNSSPTTTTAGSLNTGKPITSNGASKESENGGAGKLQDSSKRQAMSSAVPLNQSSASSPKDDEKIFKKSSDYFAKLKGLNECVAQWIKKHVDDNPFCILSPIFRDYERYLKEIEKSKYEGEGLNLPKASVGNEDAGQESKNASSMPSIFGRTSGNFVSTGDQKISAIFGSIGSDTKLSWERSAQQTDTSKLPLISVEQKSEAPKSIFGSMQSKPPEKMIFGNFSPDKNPFLNKPSGTTDNKSASEGDAKNAAKPVTTSPFASSNLGTATFSFGQSSTTTSASAGFSFGSSKPFSFGAQAVQPSAESEEKGDGEGKEEDDDEPPKVDFKPVTEEGAVYEQRCKVFIKEGTFVDRGVGRLFLKPTPNDKTQLIVRADTSLGKILINTLLTESVPTERVNKNTIMVMCVPMPECEPPPVAVLLRVKTSEDADALLEALNKYRK